MIHWTPVAERSRSFWMTGIAIETIVWSMNVIETAKIIAIEREPLVRSVVDPNLLPGSNDSVELRCEPCSPCLSSARPRRRLRRRSTPRRAAAPSDRRRRTAPTDAIARRGARRLDHRRLAALGSGPGDPRADRAGARRAQPVRVLGAARADPALEFRNCGVFGERTDEIALRLDECAAGADALIVQGGINDIAQGTPVAEAAARPRARWSGRARTSGIPVALVDVLPWNNGHPAADAPIERAEPRDRADRREEGVPVLPVPRHARGPRRAGHDARRADDRRRPSSIAGYRLLAEEALRRPRASAGLARAPRRAARPPRPPASAAARCRTSCRGRRRSSAPRR